MTDKRYIFITQLRTSVKPAQHSGRFRSERRIAYWRAGIILTCVGAVGLFILTFEVGVFDPIFRMFLK